MLEQQPAETSLDLMPIRYVQAGRFKVRVAVSSVGSDPIMLDNLLT